MTLSLGQTIRQLRTKRGLSLRKFAEEIDVSPAFESDVELNRRCPSDGVLIAMAKALAVTPEMLRERDSRLPIEALKERIAREPRFAYALRLILDSGVSAEELIRFVKRRAR